MLLGHLVTVTQVTHTGTETILGTIVPPLHFEGEEVVMVTVEGMVIETMIRGLPLPLVKEKAVTLELVPVETEHPKFVTMRLLI